jgi:hypothetical protein
MKRILSLSSVLPTIENVTSFCGCSLGSTSLILRVNSRCYVGCALYSSVCEQLRSSLGSWSSRVVGQYDHVVRGGYIRRKRNNLHTRKLDMGALGKRRTGYGAFRSTTAIEETSGGNYAGSAIHT